MKTYTGHQASKLIEVMPKSPFKGASYDRGTTHRFPRYASGSDRLAGLVVRVTPDVRSPVWKSGSVEYLVPMSADPEAVARWMVKVGASGVIRGMEYSSWVHNSYVLTNAGAYTIFLEAPPEKDEHIDEGSVRITFAKWVERNVKIVVKKPTPELVAEAHKQAKRIQRDSPLRYRVTTRKYYGDARAFYVLQVPLTDKARDLLYEFAQEDRERVKREREEKKALERQKRLAQSVNLTGGADDAIVQEALKILKKRGVKVEIHDHDRKRDRT